MKTFTATIYLGLREGYSNKIRHQDEVESLLQEYVDKDEFCVSLTPTRFIYTEGAEPGVMIGLINYPPQAMSKGKLKTRALEIAEKCCKVLKQSRASVVFTDETVLVEG